MANFTNIQNSLKAFISSDKHETAEKDTLKEVKTLNIAAGKSKSVVFVVGRLPYAIDDHWFHATLHCTKTLCVLS